MKYWTEIPDPKPITAAYESGLETDREQLEMKQSVKRILTAIQEQLVDQVSDRVNLNYEVESVTLFSCDSEEYVSVDIYSDDPYKGVVFDFRMNNENLEWSQPIDGSIQEWHNLDNNQIPFCLILFSQIF